jgi:hypothetical protein
MHDIGAHAAVRAGDQLLDLDQVVVDRPGPMLPSDRRLARLAQRDITGHGVVVTPGQLRRGAVTPGEVVRLQNLHDLLAPLHRQTLAAGTLLWITGEISGRQRGDRWPSPGR